MSDPGILPGILRVRDGLLGGDSLPLNGSSTAREHRGKIYVRRGLIEGDDEVFHVYDAASVRKHLEAHDEIDDDTLAFLQFILRWIGLLDDDPLARCDARWGRADRLREFCRRTLTTEEVDRQVALEAEHLRKLAASDAEHERQLAAIEADFASKLARARADRPNALGELAALEADFASKLARARADRPSKLAALALARARAGRPPFEHKERDHGERDPADHR